MTSKNSFLTSMRENSKRRNWLYALSALFFILYYPVGILIYNQSIMAYVNTAGEFEQSLKTIREQMIPYLGFNGITVFVLIACAILCAIQGYSYLDSRQKIDFYHSLPVSKTRRFFVIYINGILAIAVPYLISLLLGILAVGLTSWSIAAQTAPYALISFLINMLFFLAVYGLSILGVMLTGHKIIAFLGIAFLMLYELFVRITLSTYSSSFFQSFNGRQTDSLFANTFTSPAVLYLVKMNELNLRNTNIMTQAPAVMATTILPLLIFTIVFTGISYLLYLKRPSEASGKAIAFPKLKPVLSLLVMVPTSAMVGLFLFSITNRSILFLFLGFLLSLLLCHGIIEIVFGFDLRACLDHKKNLLIGTVLTVLLYLVFQFDLVGFDRYVPNPSKVESVAFVLPIHNQQYYDVDMDTRLLRYSSWFDYPYEHFLIEDAQSICSLAKSSYETYGNSDFRYSGEWPEDTTEVGLRYNLKNGRSIYRTIYLNYTENEELLNKIFTTQSYKQGVYQILDPQVFTPEFIQESQFSFSNGIRTQRLSSGNAAELLDIYRNDLLNMTFTQQSTTLACGEINVHSDYFTNRYSNSIAEWAFPVFPSFENTIAYLKANGLYSQDYAADEAVYCATVTRTCTVESSQGYGDYYTYTTEESCVDYTDKQQIQEILDAAYPTALADYTLFGLPGLSSDYNVRLNNPDSYDLQNATFYFYADRVPGFVVSDADSAAANVTEETAVE